jgi:hypothetical protein
MFIHLPTFIITIENSINQMLAPIQKEVPHLQKYRLNPLLPILSIAMVYNPKLFF